MIGGVVELVVNATALHFALQRWPKQVLGKVGLGGGGNMNWCGPGSWESDASKKSDADQVQGFFLLPQK